MEPEDEKFISGPEFQIPVPDCSLGEYLLPRMKSLAKDRVVQIESETGNSLTTGELLKLSAGLARGLLNIGVMEEDVVATVTANRNELYAVALGVIWAGGIVAPIDRTMKIYELKHMLGIMQPQCIFCEEDVAENIEQALNLLGMKATIVLFDSKREDETSYLTFSKIVVNVDVDKFKAKSLKSPSTQLAFIMSSSGTTGLPKGVGLTHRNIISQLAVNEFSGKPYSLMSCLQMPQFFWMSQTVILLLSVMTGMKRILIKDPTPENLLKTIHTYKPNCGVFAPSTLTGMLNHPDFKKYDVSSLMLIQPLGAIITERLIERVKKEWNKDIRLQQVYGITELSGVVTEADPAANILSVGRLGLGVKLKIVDVESKKSLGPNQTGEICFKSMGLMKGYVRNPEATKEAIDDDGWFHTGDLGYYDNNEFVYIVDRIKEIFKCQNVHVSPSELENLIDALPGVSEVAVIGIPNEQDGTHPMALVVKQKDHSITEDDIIKFVKENLSEAKHLKGGVKFVDSLPRTGTGKIKRKELKQIVESL